MKHLKRFNESNTESPLQGIIDKMFMRINEPDVKTKKLAEIIEMAYEMREGLLEPGGHPDNDWWAHKAIIDFTEIIVRANHKAQKMLNGKLVPDDCEDEVKQAIDEISQKIK